MLMRTLLLSLALLGLAAAPTLAQTTGADYRRFDAGMCMRAILEHKWFFTGFTFT